MLRNPHKGRDIVSCPPPPHAGLPLPEEVAVWLDRVFSELWKSPQAILLPPLRNISQELGCYPSSGLGSVRPRGSSWRRWHRHSLVSLWAFVPGCLPFSSVHLGPAAPSHRSHSSWGRGPSKLPTSGPALTTLAGDRVWLFQPGRPLFWVCSQGPPHPVQFKPLTPA